MGIRGPHHLQRSILVLVMLGLCGSLFAQDPSQSSSTDPQPKRILGVIPNYRSADALAVYKPISTKEKFTIARQDSFDRGTVALAALFGGLGQLTDANPAFGQGVQGVAKYWGASYADYTIGDYMTEAIYPTLLHQDPRYFRRGTGSKLSRAAYAMSRIFWTRTDSGGMQFNYSEIAGNSTAVAISYAYYQDNRTVSDALSKLATQIGVDMASNVLKEFAPDMARKFAHKHRAKESGTP